MLGNTQARLSWALRLPPSNYYWSVQAIDTAFCGSQWAPEQYLPLVFRDSGAEIANFWNCSLAWGDYDSDGYLDLAAAGHVGSQQATVIYHNNGDGTFTDIHAGLQAVGACSLAWGDYDNDGDLDLVVAGYYGESGESYLTCIYRNNGGGEFVDSGISLPGVNSSSVAWGDYDGDGWLDLAIAGYTGSELICKIYHGRTGTGFEDIQAGLVGLYAGSLAWGDYDNDGDLDLAATGYTTANGDGPMTMIYQNNGGRFSDIAAGLPGVGASRLAWGDYDRDGDLDLAIAGATTGTPFSSSTVGIAKVYRNENGAFVDVNAGLVGVMGCDLAWGDYDNDGWLDLVTAGLGPGLVHMTNLYHNEGSGGLVRKPAWLPGVVWPSVAWGDYDNDGDLDLVLAGTAGTGSGPYTDRIYRNETLSATERANTLPTPPTGLSATIAGADVTFSWQAGTDEETPLQGLSYNLRVGTLPGSDDISAGMSDGTLGTRRVPAMGNVQKRTSWTLRGVPAGGYYWSVQTIDSAFAGSSWASVPLPVARTIIGDANLDCRVNLLDLIFIRNRIGKDVQTGDHWQADVNRDGKVNVLDLIVSRNNLQRACDK